MTIDLRDINISPVLVPTYNDVVTNGPLITPQKYLQSYDDKEWEVFTEEYADGLKSDYISVLRTGGAGDQGVDIAAFKTEAGFKGNWDNYQCKHYNHPLTPSDILVELGKLCYYTFKEEYSVPDKYFFVGPYGVGTKLSKFLRGKHDDLKKLLIEKWPQECEESITSTEKIPLDGKLKAYVENFDFTILKDITVLKLLEVHRRTPYYHHRFGGGLPSRPIAEKPPMQIADGEANYIKKLLDAYAEFLKVNPCNMTDVEGNMTLKQHLEKARVQFYSAESLHKFSRDYLQSGEYERLQDFIYDGIENIILAQHKDGFERVRNTVQEAFRIQIDSHPLKERLEPLDRAGICHQLANNNRITWANNGTDN